MSISSYEEVNIDIDVYIDVKDDAVLEIKQEIPTVHIYWGDGQAQSYSNQTPYDRDTNPSGWQGWSRLDYLETNYAGGTWHDFFLTTNIPPHRTAVESDQPTPVEAAELGYGIWTHNTGGLRVTPMDFIDWYRVTEWAEDYPEITDLQNQINNQLFKESISALRAQHGAYVTNYIGTPVTYPSETSAATEHRDNILERLQPVRGTLDRFAIDADWGRDPDEVVADSPIGTGNFVWSQAQADTAFGEGGGVPLAYQAIKDEGNEYMLMEPTVRVDAPAVYHSTGLVFAVGSSNGSNHWYMEGGAKDRRTKAVDGEYWEIDDVDAKTQFHMPYRSVGLLQRSDDGMGGIMDYFEAEGLTTNAQKWERIERFLVEDQIDVLIRPPDMPSDWRTPPAGLLATNPILRA